MIHKRNVKRKKKKDDEEEALCAVCLNYRVKKKLTFFSYHISSHKCYRKHRGKK